MARRSELARAVRDDLSAAGFSVVPADTDPSVTAGARVSVDPLDDEWGGGVFVHWDVSYVLQAAGVDALCEGRGSDDPCMKFAGGVAEAMQDAIAEILTLAGYDVQKDVNDMSPYQLQVLRRRPGPTWRDWLNAQTQRRQEVMQETARRRDDDRA